MRKIMTALVAVVVILALYALKPGPEKSKETLNTGMLGYLGITEEDFQRGFDEFCRNITSEDISADIEGGEFLTSLTREHRTIHFYGSMMTLLMNLKSGKIDEAILPAATGRYILSVNSGYDTKFTTGILLSGISFVFLEGNEALKHEIDTAITSMKDDGTLDALAEQYISRDVFRGVQSLKPESFPGAETIRIAVTGDMPPMDMFAGDGKPAGYNTAVLAEIGKRLGKNIQFVNIEAGGRSSALFSGRADAVFWYRTTKSAIEEGEEIDPIESLFLDVPEGVILSVPYYRWKKEMIIRVAPKKGLFDFFRE